MEGVAFAFADCVEALKAAGTKVERATAVGGGSRSRVWLKIIANVLNIPIDIPAEGDFGAGLGAARLGPDRRRERRSDRDLHAAESSGIDPARQEGGRLLSQLVSSAIARSIPPSRRL